MAAFGLLGSKEVQLAFHLLAVASRAWITWQIETCMPALQAVLKENERGKKERKGNKIKVAAGNQKHTAGGENTASGFVYSSCLRVFFLNCDASWSLIIPSN